MWNRRRYLGIAAVAVLLIAGLSSPWWWVREAPAQYRLPYAAGSRFAVLQGNFRTDVSGSCRSGCGTHSAELMHYALDFDLPEGTPVLAARAGTVALAAGGWSAEHCGGTAPIADAPPGYLVSANIDNEANYVEIDHGDGTSALYLHLSEVSSQVLAKARTGGEVRQGELLGRSGRTGMTQCHPHLHFQVEVSKKADWLTTSLPVRFADHDVTSRTPDGVPVEGQSYLSDNPG